MYQQGVGLGVRLPGVRVCCLPKEFRWIRPEYTYCFVCTSSSDYFLNGIFISRFAEHFLVSLLRCDFFFIFICILNRKIFKNCQSTFIDLKFSDFLPFIEIIFFRNFSYFVFRVCWNNDFKKKRKKGHELCSCD